MEKIKRINKKIESTKDCVEVLNTYKKGNWKRKAKFNLKTSSYHSNIVRVFSDGNEFVTLIYNGYYTLFCPNLNLNEYKPVIDEINSLSSKYYTHDYGNIWLNPWNMKLWVTGGDGGIFYSEDSPKKVAKMFDEDEIQFHGAPYFHEKISSLKDSVFEAECDPEEYFNEEEHGGDDFYEDMHGYIQIGFINDICSIEYE